MSYRVNAIEREIARQQMMQQSREIHAAQEAGRKKPPGKVNIPEGTPDSEAKRIKFAAGFSSPEPDPTAGKVDHSAPTRDKFAQGFGSKDHTSQPTLLDQLMAYGERQAAQNTPAPPEQAHAAAVEPSPQARRLEASDAPRPQPGPAEQLQLPVTSAALFAELEKQVGTITTDPAMPVEIRLRQAFRNLPGDQREALVAQIEAQDFGFPGYLGKYQEAYSNVLIGDALARRLADARRLQPGIGPDELIAMLLPSAGQG